MEQLSTDKASTQPRYELGVALSGGGARGFAHAGALMAIEEAGLKPDIIAGVSAGSVVAVLYAAGFKPAHIPELFANCSFTDFTKLSLGKGGLFTVEKFRDFIMEAVLSRGDYRRLEDLPMPTYLGVTDFDNGCPVEFHTGEIGDRMIASCSIPIVFKPVTIDGVNYVDGGVLRNHPAWIIRDKCKLLIGVNVSPLPTSGSASSIVDVALRTYNLMAKANQAADMALCDLSIVTPELSGYRAFSLKHIPGVFLSGYIHTRRALKDAGMWHPTDNHKTINQR